MGFFIVKVTYMNDTQYHHKAFFKAKSRIMDAPFTSVYLPNRKLENICLS